jgi:protein-tyrosine phosphatase
MFRELIAGHAPLAFHCTAGKDRTGIAAALLLTALNVPRETVTQDYALTNLYFDASKVTHSQTTGPSPNLPQDVLNIYMRADPTYIEAVFRVMDAHPGGVPGYLHDELGLSHADIKALSRVYTERK